MKEMVKNIVKRVVAITVIAVIVGMLTRGAITKIKEAKAADKANLVAKVYPVVVKTFMPKKDFVILTLPYLSEIHNDKDVMLSSKVAGRIIKSAKSGVSVKKGDIIAKIDTTAIKSQLKATKKQIEALKISLQNFQKTHNRTLSLLKIRGASIEQSQKEESKIASLEAKLSALEEKVLGLENTLSYGIIKSPVDGVVSKVFVSKGSMSMPGHKIASISSKNGFYLLLRVPGNVRVKGVKYHNEILDAIPLKSTFRGLTEYKVYVNDKNLISGDKIQVDVVVFKGNGILLPFDCVLNRNGKTYVLEVEKNKAVAREINIVQSAEQGVVTLDDIEDKKIVVAKPDILLKLLSGYKLAIKH